MSGSRHTARYTTKAGSDAFDARLTSPVFERNCQPMIAALSPLFEGRSGPVLEIGAGTGQHAAAFAAAFPSLQWWASDLAESHRASIAAWATHSQSPVRGPLNLDAASDWAVSADVAKLGPLTGVLAMNVIHIAPIEIAEGIIRGAAKALSEGGLLLFYGPFTEHGQHITESNAAFDRGLRSDDPAWGVRDVQELAACAALVGLRYEALIEMPANNRVLVFCRIEARTHRA